VLGIFGPLNLFLSPNAVFQNQLLVDAMVKRFHHGLNVILKVFVLFTPYVEFESLVVVARNDSSVLWTLLIVTFIEIFKLKLDCFIFNWLETYLR
jgi:hypothetical protein